MTRRIKILISILDAFGGSLSSTDMQKYLFLFCIQNNYDYYNFVPYKYGCFSFVAYHDKRKLIADGLLLDDANRWKFSNQRENYSYQLTQEERIKIFKFRNEFMKIKGNELIRYLYKKYPYYAINSEILNDILTPEEVDKILSIRPQINRQGLFTIGYEGLSIEDYINKLIKADIHIVCDVRKNPISRKYGFSKSTLCNALKHVGIKYEHFSALGIPSDMRQNLNTQSDYKRLFKKYEEEILIHRNNDIHQLYDIYRKDKRVALTCFEKDHKKCHRSSVIKALIRVDPDISVRNL